MQIDREAIGRMKRCLWRLRDLHEHFGEAWQRTAELASHHDVKPLEVIVSPLETDAFQISCAGVSLMVRMAPEIDEDGALRGRVSFYEVTRSRTAPERELDFVTFDRNGNANAIVIGSEGADPPPLQEWLIDMALSLIERVLKERGAAAATA